MIQEQKAVNEVLEQILSDQKETGLVLQTIVERLDQQSELFLMIHSKHQELKRQLEDIENSCRNFVEKTKAPPPPVQSPNVISKFRIRSLKTNV